MGKTILRFGGGWTIFCAMLQLLSAGSAHGNVAALSTPAVAAGSGSRRVLLVHGIINSAKSMRWMSRRLQARGWEVYAISITPNDASVPFEAMARQLEAFVAANFPPDEKFDLVGFSMGGLVCRYYIQKLGGYARIRRFVTISTPNHGTVWACLSGSAGIREMRPGSEMLRELNADAGKLASLHYTSIYTPLDLTIVPAASSRMTVARNVISWIPLHALMIRTPGPVHAVERALE